MFVFVLLEEYMIIKNLPCVYFSCSPLVSVGVDGFTFSFP